MKKIIPTSVMVFTLGLGLSPAAYAEPVKAVSWNLEWFPGGSPDAKQEDKDKQFAIIEKEFAKLKPDIFLAQEVTDAKAFEKLVATVPAMKVDVTSNFPQPENPKFSAQQCSIASNLKADSAFFERFKATKNLPNLSRGFAFAALEHPEGGLMMIYSVHLKSNRGSDTPDGEQDVADTRAEAARQILAHKVEMEKRYAGKKIVGWLVGGDFNTNHDGQFPECTAIADFVKAGFHNSWDETPKEERLTWFNAPWFKEFKPTTFDYMMTTGFVETQAKSIRVSRYASDHNPVVLMLEKTE